MTTNLHDKMLKAIDAYFSASDAVEEEVAENLLLDVRDEINKQKYVPETNFGNMAEPKIGCVNHDCDKCKAVQEPVAWRNAALRVGEDLCSVGPFGYYDMTAEQWLDWALSVVTVHAPPAAPVQEPSRTQTKQIVDGLQRCHHPDSQHEFLRTWIRDWTIHKTAQRQWVSLTDEEITALKHNGERYISSQDFARAIEAKLREKNNG